MHPADIPAQELRNIFNSYAKKADLMAGRQAWQSVVANTLRHIEVSEPFVMKAIQDVQDGRNPIAAVRAAIQAFTIRTAENTKIN